LLDQHHEAGVSAWLQGARPLSANPG